MSRLTSIRLAQLLGTALAASLLAGCATSGLAVRANSADRAQVALAKGQVAKAIMLTEAAVAASPHDAALRVQLGQAYLKAGRFQSAATTFDDAMKLGDNSARNALSLALAKTGAGDQQGALAVLDRCPARRRKHPQAAPEPGLFLCPCRALARGADHGRAGRARRCPG